MTPDDATIRQHVIDGAKEAGIAEGYINVVVAGGIVQIWGLADSETESEAVRIAAETAPGVSAIENNVTVLPSAMRGGLGVGGPCRAGGRETAARSAGEMA